MSEFGFGAFADRFIQKHVVEGELRSRKDIEGTFDRDLRPWFGDKLVTEITNKDVKRMLAHAKLSIDALIARATHRMVPDWVMHDLRRTMATGCSELKVPLEHSEATLNHISGTKGGVAGTYHLYKFAKEKRVALQRWADKVEAICGGIPLVGPA